LATTIVCLSVCLSVGRKCVYLNGSAPVFRFKAREITFSGLITYVLPTCIIRIYAEVKKMTRTYFSQKLSSNKGYRPSSSQMFMSTCQNLGFQKFIFDLKKWLTKIIIIMIIWLYNLLIIPDLQILMGIACSKKYVHKRFLSSSHYDFQQLRYG
jgi:hypothetical protein